MRRHAIASVLPAAFAAACVAAALVVAGAPLGRPALITALVGLAAAGFVAGLAFSMGLHRERAGLRLAIAVPLVMAAALAVVLMLDAHHRAAAAVVTVAGSG